MITSNNKIDDPLKVPGNYVTLPFPFLRLSWVNGYAGRDPKTVEGMGGFQAGVAEFESDVAALGDYAPSYFKGPSTWQDAKGQKTYDVYHSRAIYAAPIGSRVRWSKFEKNGKMVNASKTEILVYLADIDAEKHLVPYGPAVISAKSYEGNFLLDAFKAWVADSAEIRKTEAPGVPSAFFYVPIGTFGDKRLTKLVGKVEKSPVVPAQVGKIAWTPENLGAYHVGAEVEALMVSLHEQAGEWLTEKADNKAETTPKPVDNSANDLLIADESVDDAFPID